MTFPNRRQPTQPSDLYAKRLRPLNDLSIQSRADRERAELPKEHPTPELDRKTLNLPPDAGRDPRSFLSRRREVEE